MGTIRHITVNSVTSVTGDPAGRATNNWLMFAERGGRRLGANDSHQVDLVRFWLGEVAAVSGELRTMMPDRTDRTTGAPFTATADDITQFSLEMENGPLVRVLVSGVLDFEWRLADRTSMQRIGVDVGGIFTDFTLLDEASGELHSFKLPSTPTDPSIAIKDGILHLLQAHHLKPADVTYIGHGTTVATNIVIERAGARTGLLTTRGFRDILELGRQARPSIYDYRFEKPIPLVPRDRRFEVTERIGPDGEVIIPLDEASLEQAAQALAAAGVESVAICFLQSYRAPEHEAAAKAVEKRVLPDAYVIVSSEILPEFREFERMSTTVVNAFVGPRMSRYLDRLKSRIAATGIPAQPYTIHSNGGLMSAETVRECPVRTCVSGPAAGVVGATEIGRVAGFADLITFDVGGTSTAVSLIADAQPLYTSARLVAGYPVKTPMLDIHLIGAGGGSIAVIDAAGALKVGPVAYGRGGTKPTMTDANLYLGRLAPPCCSATSTPTTCAAISPTPRPPVGPAFSTCSPTWSAKVKPGLPTKPSPPNSAVSSACSMRATAVRISRSR